MRSEGRRLPAIAAVALTTMMGVHALRGFLAMIVWNIGVDRPALVLGGIALAVYAAGLAGWIAAPRLDTPRATNRLAVVFAVVYALSHYVRHPLLTPTLALAAATFWLWLFPALIGRLSRGHRIDALAPGILAGFGAQVALQTALHGLDLAMLRGILPGLGATVLAALLLIAWRSLDGVRGEEGIAGRQVPGWGMIAFGPYLILQLTLLASIGRAQMLTGAALPVASLPILLGLAAGAAVIIAPASSWLRAAAAAASVILVLPAGLSRQGTVFLFCAQIVGDVRRGGGGPARGLCLDVPLLLALRMAGVVAPARCARGDPCPAAPGARPIDGLDGRGCRGDRRRYPWRCRRQHPLTGSRAAGGSTRRAARVAIPAEVLKFVPEAAKGRALATVFAGKVMSPATATTARPTRMRRSSQFTPPPPPQRARPAPCTA